MPHGRWNYGRIRIEFSHIRVPDMAKFCVFLDAALRMGNGYLRSVAGRDKRNGGSADTHLRQGEAAAQQPAAIFSNFYHLRNRRRRTLAALVLSENRSPDR